MIISNIISVEDVLVRKEVVNTHFECDLTKCKGACCTFESKFGAPLLDDEIEQITEVLPEVSKYLSKSHLDEISKKGFFEEIDNEIFTSSINNKACVFVYYDGDIAKCAIEKAFLEGTTNFKKPISCHLFPIRISNFDGDILRFEKFSECSPALEKGKLNKTELIDFCKESLTRLYGKNWFKKLKELIGR